MSVGAVLLAVFTVGLLAPAADLAADPAGSVRFTAGMIERLQRADPKSRFAPATGDPLSIAATSSTNEQRTINLHRLYGFCRQATKEDCESEKSTFIRGVLAPVPKSTRESLRLIVRDREYVDSIRQRPNGNTLIIARLIGDDLFAVLAFDAPQSIALASPDALQRVGLSREEAWDLADRQTRAILPPLPDPAELASEVIVMADGEYLASLLAQQDTWSKLAAATGPDLHVSAVSDSFVVIGTMPPGPSLDKLRKMIAEDCAAERRCISPNLYRFRNGRWQVIR